MPRSRSANRYSAQLRIIGGKWKGRKLKFRPIGDLRPTLGRTRETLFNWLRPELAHSRCLDLFAGSGALGLEALSQGAGEVTFVDSNRPTIKQIEAHLIDLDVGLPSRAICMDAARYLRQEQQPWQIIFMDPPFRSPELMRTILMLIAATQPQVQYVYLESNNHPVATAAITDAGFSVHKQTRAGEAHGYLLLLNPET